MNRIAPAIILLLLIGISLHSLIGEGRSAAPAAAAVPMMQAIAPATPPQDLTAARTQSDRSATQPAATTQSAATTRPVFTSVHGKKGFWQLVKTADGVWWYRSPEGRLEFMNTVTTVQPYQVARDRIGPSYVSRDWDGGITAKGDFLHWANATWKRVHAVGFKGLGAWCNPAFHQIDVPISRDLNVWTWMSPGSKRFYSKDWAPTAEHAIKVQVEPLKDNHNVIGYFIDNELDWGDGGAGPSLYFDNLPPGDPNRRQVIDVMKSIWTTLDSFNKDWGTQFKDWKELDSWPTLAHGQSGAYGRLFAAWLSHLSEDYFRLTTGLIRKYDPNHLILGVRFKGWAPLEVVRASKGYTDAQSLNMYVGDGFLDADLFRMMNEESGQPVIITEYSFHALDGRSGNRNTVGFAAQVLDQQARADGYRLLTTRLARVPYIVGADWFQWMDEPPSGRSNDGEDVNFGIVDVDDRVYKLLADSIRKTTPLLNPLHAASPHDDGKDIWRESFANKPVMHVPYLTHPPKLNGELSDWAPDTRLPGIRHSQTIGLERSSVPLPQVYMGWTREGLYLGMEVFDNDIQGTPADGWWWTRDHVEFFLSTRPVSSDQNAYDPYCHQFFFVPQSFPVADGIAGVVGQWHRPGDALKGNLIPHPTIRCAVRVLSDRYVLEMFIPGKALHGWDPVKQPAMAFNVHASNFQHALDYFWSAPKEVRTQLRPCTWGSLYLEPQGATPVEANAAPEKAPASPQPVQQASVTLMP